MSAQQLQFLLTGVPVTEVREDIRTVQVVARSAGPDRLDPAKLGDLTLAAMTAQLMPLSQIGHIEIVHGRSDPETARSHADDHGAERHR